MFKLHRSKNRLICANMDVAQHLALVLLKNLQDSLELQHNVATLRCVSMAILWHLWGSTAELRIIQEPIGTPSYNICHIIYICVYIYMISTYIYPIFQWSPDLWSKSSCRLGSVGAQHVVIRKGHRVPKGQIHVRLRRKVHHGVNFLVSNSPITYLHISIQSIHHVMSLHLGDLGAHST
jgi:hypothetical protein